MGSFLFPRSFVQLGLALSVWGLSRLGFSSSTLDAAQSGPVPLLRSSAWLGPFSSVYGIIRLELPPSMLDFIHLGFVTWLQLATVHMGLSWAT